MYKVVVYIKLKFLVFIFYVFYYCMLKNIFDCFVVKVIDFYIKIVDKCICVLMVVICFVKNICW